MQSYRVSNSKEIKIFCFGGVLEKSIPRDIAALNVEKGVVSNKLGIIKSSLFNKKAVGNLVYKNERDVGVDEFSISKLREICSYFKGLPDERFIIVCDTSQSALILPKIHEELKRGKKIIFGVTGFEPLSSKRSDVYGALFEAIRDINTAEFTGVYVMALDKRTNRHKPADVNRINYDYKHRQVIVDKIIETRHSGRNNGFFKNGIG